MLSFNSKALLSQWKTAQCRCKLRYVAKFTAASRDPPCNSMTSCLNIIPFGVLTTAFYNKDWIGLELYNADTCTVRWIRKQLFTTGIDHRPIWSADFTVLKMKLWKWVTLTMIGIVDRALAGPWKSLNFFLQIFKAWKVLENRHGPWKCLNQIF